MPERELELLFARFQRHGDLDALAQVFDRVAEKLLRIARRLAHDEASAEDLVQATFLGALEHADRFDASRELEAWLIGILTRKAQELRRRQSRTPDPERLSTGSEHDPLRDAELAEFVATLEQTLSRVPEAYRAVLRRHLADGEAPDEIARALERSPNTVRVQLHRGMQHLRRLLPAGFALGAAAIVLRPRGLAAVREVVLSSAPSYVPAASVGAASASTTVLIGAWWMNKKLLAVCALVVVLIGAGAYRIASTREGSPSSVDASANAVSLAPEGGPSIEPKPPALAAPTIDIEADARSPQAADPYGSLDVEIVWADETPAAGIEFTASPKTGRDTLRDERTGTVDERGRVRFARVLEGECTLLTDRLQPTPKTAMIERGKETHVRCVMPRGTDVRGHVRDNEDRPIAGAIVGFKWGEYGHMGKAGTRTDAAGAYLLRALPEYHAVFAMHPDFVVSDERPLRGLPLSADGTCTVDIVLSRGGQRVEGRVFDPSGAPVAGAAVALQLSNTTLYGTRVQSIGLETQTDAVGHFEFFGQHAAKGTVIVRTLDFALARRPVVVAVTEPTRVDVHLARGVLVEGVVRDESGRACGGARILEDTPENDAFEFFAFRCAYSDDEGRFTLGPLAVDVNAGVALTALSTHGGRRQSAQTVLHGTDGATMPWNPVLTGGLVITGRVEDEAGRAIAGWHVQTFPDDKNKALPPEATTDVDGRFRVEDCLPMRYALHVWEPRADVARGAVLRASRENVDGGETDVVIRVSPDTNVSSFVVGRVVDWDGKAFADAKVRLRAETGWGEASGEVKGEDGAFRIGPVAPGAWHLEIESPRTAYAWRPAFELAADKTKDLGEIRLARPGTFELTLRCRDGTPLENGSVMLTEAQNRGHSLKSDDGVLFRSEPLQPGTYGLRGYMPRVTVPARDVEIRSGEVTRLELELESAVARQLLCVLPEGQAPPSTFFARVLDAKGVEVARQDGAPPTSEHGPLLTVVVKVPVGHYTYECRAGTEWEADGAFDVLDLEQPHVVIQVALKPRR